MVVAEHSGWTGFYNTSWSLKTNNNNNNSTNNINGGTSSKHEQMTTSTTSDQVLDLNFNGSSKVLYWADVSAEITFVVPTEWNLTSEIDGNCCSQCTVVDNASSRLGTNLWGRHQSSLEVIDMQKKEVTPHVASQRNKNLILELESNKNKEPVPPARRKMAALKPTLLVQASVKILLVWLESYEDHLNFPIGKIFLTKLKNI